MNINPSGNIETRNVTTNLPPQNQQSEVNQSNNLSRSDPSQFTFLPERSNPASTDRQASNSGSSLNFGSDFLMQMLMQVLKNLLPELFKESPSSADDSPANQGSPSNGSPAGQSTPNNGNPANQGSASNGSPTGQSTPNNGSPANQGSPSNGGSAERSTPNNSSPANQGSLNNDGSTDRSSKASDGSSSMQALPNSTPISSTKGQAGAPPIPSGIPAADARELRSAGVGDTKQPTNVAAVVESGSSRVDVQNAIDKAAKAGGGIVELKGGDFKIDKTLDLKSGVVLKGAEDTRLLGTMTGDTSIVRIDDGVKGAGLKDLTVQHVGNGKPPRVDDFENRLPNAEVTSVEINGNNNTIDNVNIKNSGSDPLVIKGDHNTIQNSNIDGSYNKGGGGNGYIDIRGGEP